jgi:hypothetical protein
MKKLAAAATAITLLLATPALAQRPLSGNQLPNSGIANYEGTVTGNDFTTPISLTVDLGAGTVAADLTIPMLFPGTPFESPPRHFTPTGTIDVDGGFLITQGLNFASDSNIVMSGNFFLGQAKEIQGQFITFFCVCGSPETTGVIRTRSGTFSAVQ